MSATLVEAGDRVDNTKESTDDRGEPKQLIMIYSCTYNLHLHDRIV